MNFVGRVSFRQIIGKVLMALLLGSFSCACLAQSLRLDSAGVRAGIYSSGAGGDFHQAEMFLDWDLPWDTDLGSLWQLSWRLDASLGWLGESGADAAIITGGPSLLLTHGQFPL